MVYPNDDKQGINLEHVLPEQVENNWPEFDEDTARIYVRRIGNLALLLAKNNSDLRSSDFKTKRAAYKNGPYELTRMISKVPRGRRTRLQRGKRYWLIWP
jgi:hypothetical protein